MTKPAIIYLEREGNDLALYADFHDSMKLYDAGEEFDYIHLFKRLDDPKFALGSLVDCLNNISNDKFLFFTSSSRILAPIWLKGYMDAFRNIPNCGIVSATGSYERNVCVRTNAFMMDRKLFIELADGRLETRNDEYNFEAGDNNLTSLIVGRGLVPIVIDKDGTPWTSDQWEQSKTFRSGNQEMLLVSDNRTRDYDLDCEGRKEYFRKMTWTKNDKM